MATHLRVIGGHEEGFAATQRRDAWWVSPLVVLLGLSAFVAYANWALFEADYYYAEPYLSPFYAPVLFTDSRAVAGAPLSIAWFGEWPTWWPGWLPASPAMLILIFPLSFRFTCYYYRKAYYRAFAGSPPACAVGPLAAGKRPRGAGKSKYNGETALLVFQNLHRYALYFAIVFIFLLAYEAVLAFSRDGKLGVGVGSIVLVINVVLIAAYTLGCHSFRHLVGGHDDCMSCGKAPGTRATVKLGAWRRVTWLNERHQFFAWASLIWVALSDVYVRLVAMNAITDLNTWTI